MEIWLLIVSKLSSPQCTLIHLSHVVVPQFLWQIIGFFQNRGKPKQFPRLHRFCCCIVFLLLYHPIAHLQDQQQSGSRSLSLPLRASATNSILMRKSSDSSSEELKSPVLNGNGILPSSNTGSRLGNSIIFRSYRSSSIDLSQENGKTHRPLLHTSSLPEVGPTNDRMSAAQKEPSELGTGTDTTGPRFDRFSFLLNSSSSASGSLTGAEDPSPRMSRPPSLSISSPPSSNSPTRLLSPTGSIDLHRPFTTPESPISMFGQTLGIGMGMGMGVGAGTTGDPILQRSFSGERTAGVQQTSLFNSVHGGSQFQSQEPEPDRNLVLKYRAFPDAYVSTVHIV